MWANQQLIDLPYGGWFSLQMTHFHLHCMVEEVEVDNHHDVQVTRMAGWVEVVELYPGQSGCSRYPAGLCCTCAAAHSSSSQKFLAGNCRHIRLALSWHHGHNDGPAPDPSDHPDFGYVSQGDHHTHLYPLSDDH